MEAQVKKHDTIRLKKIDIANWGSPVAEKYGVNRIPQVRLYRGTELVEQDTQKIMNRLMGLD